jgi:hypothetical protein
MHSGSRLLSKGALKRLQIKATPLLRGGEFINARVAAAQYSTFFAL